MTGDTVDLFRKFGLHASARALAQKEGLTCRTCVHLETDARDEPCMTCKDFQRWQGPRVLADTPRVTQALSLLTVLETRLAREMAKQRPNSQVVLMLSWLQEEARLEGRT